MNEVWLVSFVSYLEPLLCATAIAFLWHSKSVRSYYYLLAFLAVRLFSGLAGLSVVHLSVINVIDVRHAYRIYFCVYWGSYAVEAIISIFLVYSIFKLSMAPLPGLQTLGTLIFRWAAAISAAVTIGIALAPHHSGVDFVVGLVSQMQQTSSIVTLCLLLFVCFAIRPMGLSQRSRIFGVSFGLGIMAAINLVVAAWLSHSPDMQSTVNLINGTAMCAALCIWSAYFAMPEPKRRIIVLPTTSPFHRWNQISAVLGDDPGYVAIGGIPPELFAPAEIELMKRASAMMPPKIDSSSSLRSISA